MGDTQRKYLPAYTYEDYKLWEGKWELIYGVPYAMLPAPMIKHQNISNKIAWVLQNELINCKECQALLPVDWRVNDETIVQPDNLVICHKPKNAAYISKAPVIIFEILSKSTAQKDLHLKYELYEKEGVKYYVIVDPDEDMAKIYQNKDGKYIKLLDATDELIEFEIKQCDEKLRFDFSKIW